MESLVKDEEGLVTLLTKASMHYKLDYIYIDLFINYCLPKGPQKYTTTRMEAICEQFSLKLHVFYFKKAFFPIMWIRNQSHFYLTAFFEGKKEGGGF